MPLAAGHSSQTDSCLILYSEPFDFHFHSLRMFQIFQIEYSKAVYMEMGGSRCSSLEGGAVGQSRFSKWPYLIQNANQIQWIVLKYILFPQKRLWVAPELLLWQIMFPLSSFSPINSNSTNQNISKTGSTNLNILKTGSTNQNVLKTGVTGKFFLCFASLEHKLPPCCSLEKSVQL